MGSQDEIRILFIADTHLGFDMTQRPRIQRRRRGLEFFENFDRAVRPVWQGQVDVVIHGGDLFYRSRIPNWLTVSVFERVRHITERGVPVLIVPGNHERSALPSPLLWNLPNLYVFDDPRTVVLPIRGMRLALSGFPYSRADLRQELARLIARTGWHSVQSDIRLLCIHQIVQGARVGVRNFTFTRGPDVIPKNALPAQFACVLAGHVHRFQVLGEDGLGNHLPCRVFYPGSTERTSFAERDEEKGYLTLRVVPTDCGRGAVDRWMFEPLPSRPMKTIELAVEGLNGSQVRRRLEQCLEALDPESIARLMIAGRPEKDALQLLTAQALRSMAPSTMNIDLRWHESTH